MDVQFERLRLSGWKSIRELDLELRPLTVLVGGNGAGKSNLIEFFRLLNALADGRFQVFVGSTGGPESLLHFGSKTTPRVTCDLRVRAAGEQYSYAASWIPGRPEGLVFEAERAGRPAGPTHGLYAEGLFGGGYQESELVKPSPEAAWVVKPIRAGLAHCRVYHFHDAGPAAGFRQAGRVNLNNRLEGDAGNLAAMLYLYRERYPTLYRRIRAAVRAVLPDFDDFAVEPLRLRPLDLLLEWKAVGREYVFGPHQLSDGTIRFMALATLLLQPDEDLPALVLLDEPELGLHPAALGVLADLLKGASARTRVLVATQSAVLLDHFDPADVVTVNRRDGASVFERLDPERLNEWRDGEFSLSDLWQRNVFGGGPY